MRKIISSGEVRKNFIDQIHVNNYIMFLNATFLDSFPFYIKIGFIRKYKIYIYKMLIIYYCKIHNLINY